MKDLGITIKNIMVDAEDNRIGNMVRGLQSSRCEVYEGYSFKYKRYLITESFNVMVTTSGFDFKPTIESIDIDLRYNTGESIIRDKIIEEMS